MKTRPALVASPVLAVLLGSVAAQVLATAIPLSPT